MNGIWIGLAILLGAGIVAGAIMMRPGDFRECVLILASDIERADPTATLDPRDVEAQAARECSGFGGR